jgi:hypothetical protein
MAVSLEELLTEHSKQEAEMRVRLEAMGVSRAAREIAVIAERMGPQVHALAQAHRQHTLALLSLHDRADAGAVAELLRVAEATLPKSLVASIAAFNATRIAMLSVMPSELHAAFNDLLAGSIVPTITALGALPVSMPTGIFSILDHQNLFGSLSWFVPSEDDDEPRVAVAAWQTEMRASDQHVTINLRCKTRCMFCDGAMLSADQKISATSLHDIVVTLAIVPICGICAAKARKDPRYYLKQIEKLSRPKLRLIKGEGVGDGAPRGTLSLVENEEED